MQLAVDNIISREELEDGSTVYEIGEEILPQNDHSGFDIGSFIFCLTTKKQ